MTREEIDKATKDLELVMFHLDNNSKIKKSYKIAIEALKAEPCEDAISRQEVLGCCRNEWEGEVEIRLKALPSVNPQPKTGHCKDCKWWKDSDGVYRRGVRADSQCPINRKEVYEGNGYCFLYEPQERSDKE